MVKGKGTRLLWTDDLRIVHYPKDPYCRYHICKRDGGSNWTDVKLTEEEAKQLHEALYHQIYLV